MRRAAFLRPWGALGPKPLKWVTRSQAALAVEETLETRRLLDALGLGLYCGMFGAMLTSLHAAGIRSSAVGSSGFVSGSLGLGVQSRPRDDHSLQDAVSMQQGIRSSFPSHSVSPRIMSLDAYLCVVFVCPAYIGLRVTGVFLFLPRFGQTPWAALGLSVGRWFSRCT